MRGSAMGETPAFILSTRPGVRDGGDAGVYLVDAPGVDVDGGDVVVLREQAGKRESDVAESSDGDVHDESFCE